MKVLRTAYSVWMGDTFIVVENSFEEAKAVFDKIPSGQGKRPGVRRSLIREEVLIEDTRD